jgi:hypothetical protein
MSTTAVPLFPTLGHFTPLQRMIARNERPSMGKVHQVAESVRAAMGI